MSETSRLSEYEVATLAEEYVERHMQPQNPAEVYRTVNSVHSFLLITNMKQLGEKEHETYKDLAENQLYQIYVLENGSKKTKYVDKQALLNLAAGRERYGGLDLLGIKVVDFSQKPIEVKADRHGKYLHRDKPDWSEGSLGFEIWSKPDRSTVGWVYDYVHYDSMNKYMVENASKRKCVPATYCFPSVFVYVLSYEIGREFHPYATVCFENTEALFDLVDNKLDGRLKNWSADNKKAIIEEGFINGAYMQKNMLYISMRELCALPDVTVTLYQDTNIECILRNCLPQQCNLRKKKDLIKKRIDFLHSAITTREVREQRSNSEQLLLNQRTEEIPELF